MREPYKMTKLEYAQSNGLVVTWQQMRERGQTYRYAGQNPNFGAKGDPVELRFETTGEKLQPVIVNMRSGKELRPKRLEPYEFLMSMEGHCHTDLIEQAHTEGKIIPEAVLADYADLGEKWKGIVGGAEGMVTPPVLPAAAQMPWNLRLALPHEYYVFDFNEHKYSRTMGRKFQVSGHENWDLWIRDFWYSWIVHEGRVGWHVFDGEMMKGEGTQEEQVKRYLEANSRRILPFIERHLGKFGPSPRYKPAR